MNYSKLSFKDYQSDKHMYCMFSRTSKLYLVTLTVCILNNKIIEMFKTIKMLLSFVYQYTKNTTLLEEKLKSDPL